MINDIIKKMDGSTAELIFHARVCVITDDGQLQRADGTGKTQDEAVSRALQRAKNGDRV